jgi:hypothetical protein
VIAEIEQLVRPEVERAAANLAHVDLKPREPVRQHEKVGLPKPRIPRSGPRTRRPALASSASPVRAVRVDDGVIVAVRSKSIGIRGDAQALELVELGLRLRACSTSLDIGQTSVPPGLGLCASRRSTPFTNRRIIGPERARQLDRFVDHDGRRASGSCCSSHTPCAGSTDRSRQPSSASVASGCR